jgi:hypothetical protein
MEIELFEGGFWPGGRGHQGEVKMQVDSEERASSKMGDLFWRLRE